MCVCDSKNKGHVTCCDHFSAKGMQLVGHLHADSATCGRWETLSLYRIDFGLEGNGTRDEAKEKDVGNSDTQRFAREVDFPSGANLIEVVFTLFQRFSDEGAMQFCRHDPWSQSICRATTW